MPTNNPILAKPKVLTKPPVLSKSEVFNGKMDNMGSPKSKEAHMAKSQASGGTHRGMADDFNTSKSTVGRTLKQGYSKINTIKD